MPTLLRNKHFFHPFVLPKDTSFPSFEVKVDKPNPSEMDIRVSIPAPTFHFTDTSHFLNWKMRK